jgi:hypothetical protein
MNFYTIEEDNDSGLGASVLEERAYSLFTFSLILAENIRWAYTEELRVRLGGCSLLLDKYNTSQETFSL